MQVAQEILNQLGGRMFIRMTVAKNLLADKNALIFALPSRFATDGINKVRITLDPSDTYTVSFFKVWGAKLTTIAEVSDVYCDTLRGVFTQYTGLDCTL